MDITFYADILLSAGSLIGLTTKIYALSDESTSWSRKSSGINILTYPFTALIPFFILGLWYTFAVSVVNFLVWLGIFIWRAPENEDWKGFKQE